MTLESSPLTADASPAQHRIHRGLLAGTSFLRGYDPAFYVINTCFFVQGMRYGPVGNLPLLAG